MPVLLNIGTGHYIIESQAKAATILAALAGATKVVYGGYDKTSYSSFYIPEPETERLNLSMEILKPGQFRKPAPAPRPAPSARHQANGQHHQEATGIEIVIPAGPGSRPRRRRLNGERQLLLGNG